MRIKAIPPTTPPTIAPVFDELFVVEGELVETGIEVVVDISVVTTIVDPTEFIELVDGVNDYGRNEIRVDKRKGDGYCSSDGCHGGCGWSCTSGGRGS